MDNHSKYHSGQYLFFIPFSTGRAVTRERWPHQDEQDKNWGPVRRVPLRLKVRGNDAPNEPLIPDQPYPICPRDVRREPLPKQRKHYLVC